MSRRGRVDIALSTQGRILGLIEAKAPGTLLDKHVDQVLGYAFYESAEICALTTGLEWWLYLPGARVPIPKRRFAVLRVLEDPIGRLSDDLTSFLGRGSLVSGQAGELANHRLEEVRLNDEVPSLWKQMLQEPDNELVELLRKRVRERTHFRLTTEQVTAALGGSQIPAATKLAEPPEAPQPEVRPQPKPTKRKKPRPSVKPAAIELWGERHPVSSHQNVLKKVIDLLYERHRDDFHRVLELKGQKYPYAARDPRNVKYGEDGAYYEPANSGFFFDTHLSASGVERRTRKLVTHFGHNPSDLKILYDQEPAE